MMKKIVAAALLACVAALPARAQVSPKCTGCGNDSYGTSIVWEGTAEEAAKKALKEEKLVFVLHVSGNFEDPKFT